MGWRERLRFTRDVAMTAPITPEPTPPRARFSASSSLLDGPWSDAGMWQGFASSLARRVSRDEALSVPCVMRARNMIAAIATLPLRTVDGDRNEVRVPLLEQIDRNVGNVVTMAATVEDLLFEGVSWWRVTAFGWDNYPVFAEHIQHNRVHVPPVGRVRIDGIEVDSAELIRFDSPAPALLVYAARSIRRALLLERAAAMYAADPQMLGFFTPADGVTDPGTDEAITQMLDDFQAAKAERTTPYMPAAIKYNPLSVMSPADLQLAQLQDRVALDIANMTGLDPENLGVSTTSRVYTNATDRRQDRINDVLALYMRAITDRLSMGDVTKRGQRVVFDLDDYLKSDPKTRAEVASILRGLDAITVDEIREAEEKPVLTPAQARALAPKPAPVVPAVPAQSADAKEPLMAVPARGVVSFAREAGITFDLATTDASFTVDENTRTVTGLAVPWGQVARSDGRRWRFERGSVKWSDTGRVKLLRDHDHSQALGKAIALNDTPAGLVASFKVARGKAGDEALQLAADGVLDGLSIGIDFHDGGTIPDPQNRGVNLVQSAALREVSLTAVPSFDDSRLTSVAASAPARDLTMSDVVPEQAPAQPAPAAAPDTAAFTSAVEAFTAAVENLGVRLSDPQHEQRATVDPSRATVVESLVYTLDGRGNSFVQDAWNVHKGRYGSAETQDAFARIQKYEKQTQDLAHRAFMAGGRTTFANAGNTTDQAQLLPPGYRPDLYVGQIPQGRPLFEAVSSGTIQNANPFKVPVWVGSAGLNGTNSEGTGPSTGTITDHTYRTVSPTAQSGEFVITRELVDSSNPAIDQIALAAMREEYARDTEGVIAAALAAATDNDTGSGQSTEGCYVSASVGDGADLDDALMDHLSSVPFRRFLPPNRIVASSTGFPALAKAKDSSGRRLFPYIAPQNAGGTLGQGAQSLEVYGLACRPAYALEAGVDDVMLWNAVDLWAWESGLLTFRFEEKQGPENIVLNIWGYFGFQILRYTGINATNHTGA